MTSERRRRARIQGAGWSAPSHTTPTQHTHQARKLSTQKPQDTCNPLASDVSQGHFLYNAASQVHQSPDVWERTKEMTIPKDICRKHRTIHWFRKGLRLHDNPAFMAALSDCQQLTPVFILDPWFVKNYRVGPNRWRFLQQSLACLDSKLRKLGSRMYVVRGTPFEALPKLFQDWNITKLTFEVDVEPYALERDRQIEQQAEQHGVIVVKQVSHTLYDTKQTVEENGGKPPLTYQQCLAAIRKHGHPGRPHAPPAITHFKGIESPDLLNTAYNVPSLEELGVRGSDVGECLYPGGEEEAMRRMEETLNRQEWVCRFEKPNTDPVSLVPSTTVLSPYLKFGCLSPRLFYWRIQQVYDRSKNVTKPPQSLHGQLFWREFFYTIGSSTPNFNKMEGNPICKQISWNKDPELLEAWKNARTGFPIIDAIMTQLRQEGWIHHIARHIVACFLTRGHLWQSWQQGMQVFEEFLLDADVFLNAANWMWLSASAFFDQYHRVYNPIYFGKKTDRSGKYIRKYVPVLRKFPSEFIYEPWTAPIHVQKTAGCIIGSDYPLPIVDHEEMKAINLERMDKVYSKSRKEIGT